MRHLNQNTLVDIARHSNKTLKLANFMVQAGYPFIYGEMARIGKTTPAVDAIEAFNKDVDKTVSQLGQVHELLSTVDDNGYVAHLKNDEKNLKTIFGDAYDHETKTIHFNSCHLNLRKPFSKQEMANDILKNTVGQTQREFKDMYKKRNKVFKLDDQSLYTDEDRIYFLSIVKNREEYKKSLDAIRELGEGFSDYRNNLSLSQKNQIDNEITFNRSMIDSVTKGSTYITQDDGVVQLASAHKKEPNNVDRLANFLKTNNFIKEIELDSETSLEAVSDVLNKTKSINFNLETQVVFKARKLGNYNANGLYMDGQRIVAVDIKNPSALIHEFVHAVDLGSSDIFHSKQRDDIANKYRKHINDEDLEQSQRNYYLRTEEIIARLGEVGYILNAFDYQQGENLDDFKKRVEAVQESDDPYDLNVAKPIKTYLDGSPNVYFNLRQMPEDDLMEVKSYYQSYFGVNNDDIKPINSTKIDNSQKQAKVVGKRMKHELKPISFFSADNVKFALDYNKENQVIEFDKLFNAFFSSPVDIDRTVKKYDSNTHTRQSLFFERLGEWVKDQNNSYLTYTLLNNYYPASPHANFRKANGFREAVVNDNEMIFEQQSQERMARFNQKKKDEEQLLDDHKHNRISNDFSMKYRQIKSSMETEVRRAVNEFRHNELEESELLENANDFYSNAYVLQRNDKKRATQTLKREAKSDLFSRMFSRNIKDAVRQQGLSAIFAHSTQQDLLPFEAMVGTQVPQLLSSDFKSNIIDFRRDVFSGLLETDIAQPFFENKDNTYQPYQLKSQNSFYTGNVMGDKISPRQIMTEILTSDLVPYLDDEEHKDDQRFIDLLKMTDRFKSPFNGKAEKEEVQNEFLMSHSSKNNEEPKNEEDEQLISYITHRKTQEQPEQSAKTSNDDNSPIDPNNVEEDKKKKRKNERQMKLF